jgi:hypothetical protein
MGVSPFSYINSVSQAAVRDSKVFLEASEGNFDESDLDSSIEEDLRFRGFLESAKDYYETIYRASVDLYLTLSEDQDED